MVTDTDQVKMTHQIKWTKKSKTLSPVKRSLRSMVPFWVQKKAWMYNFMSQTLDNIFHQVHVCWIKPSHQMWPSWVNTFGRRLLWMWILTNNLLIVFLPDWKKKKKSKSVSECFVVVVVGMLVIPTVLGEAREMRNLMWEGETTWFYTKSCRICVVLW